MSVTGLWDQHDILSRHPGKLVITPHAGEMAALTGLSKEHITAEPIRVAQEVATHLQCIVVLKGSATVIAQPDGPTYLYNGGGVGLATSGSGDVLAGVLGGSTLEVPSLSRRHCGAFTSMEKRVVASPSASARWVSRAGAAGGNPGADGRVRASPRRIPMKLQCATRVFVSLILDSCMQYRPRSLDRMRGALNRASRCRFQDWARTGSRFG